MDHHEAFKSGMEGINKLSRERSTNELKAVKELFQHDFDTSKKIVDWWTEIVRTSTAADMEAVAKDRTEPWSATIDDVVTDPTAFEQHKLASQTRKTSRRKYRAVEDLYKKVVTTAERLNQLKMGGGLRARRCSGRLRNHEKKRRPRW